MLRCGAPVVGIEVTMNLEGIHHVSSITGNAQANVDFYAGVLGLRLVKKTVNQDDPTVYHLFYGDDKGSPGLDLTFFEYPGAAPGRAGQGMIHRIVLRVASEPALDFWERRLGTAERSRGSLLFEDPEGLGLELRVVDGQDAPLAATHPEIPAKHAIRGFEEVRAYTAIPNGAAASSRTVWASSRMAGCPGSPEARAGAAGTSTTRHQPSGACLARAPCTMWRGHRWMTSSSSGVTA